MGFRMRKSINLGGGFRINLSKSGVGYSWGTKGFRMTRTSRGTTRRTYSIPGTGLSYVSEKGSGRRNNRNRTTQPTHNFPQRNRTMPQPITRQPFQPAYEQPQPMERVIQSADIEQFREAEEGIVSDALERTINLNWFGTLLLLGVLLMLVHPVFVLLPIAGLILKIGARTVGRIDLDYSFDSEKEDEHNRRIGAWQLLAEGKKEWQVMTEQFNSNTKVNAGAGRSLKRVPCSIRRGHPYYIKTNVETIQVGLANKETLIIMPDKVFFVRKRKVATIDYSDFRIQVSETRFVETDPIPKDAQVVGHTWQYVNKNGTPDQRYKNNRQIPVCLYGQVYLRSATGLNIELQISNIQNARDFAELIH